jgi:hypothetical protein
LLGIREASWLLRICKNVSFLFLARHSAPGGEDVGILSKFILFSCHVPRPQLLQLCECCTVVLNPRSLFRPPVLKRTIRNFSMCVSCEVLMLTYQCPHFGITCPLSSGPQPSPSLYPVNSGVLICWAARLHSPEGCRGSWAVCIGEYLAAMRVEWAKISEIMRARFCYFEMLAVSGLYSIRC